MRENILDLCKPRKWRVTRRVRQRLEAITDLKHLERMFHRLLEASDWDDLLGTP